MFWKIYFLYDFWCTKKLVCSEPFLEYPYEPWHLLSALYSDVRKKIYRCTLTFSAVRYCSRILFKSVCYLYEVVHTTFSSISGVFAIFDRNFVKIVTPHSNQNENSHFFWKKGEKSIKIDQLTLTKYLFKYVALERTGRRSRSVTDKQNPYKHHIFALTADANPQAFHGYRRGRDH